MIVIKKKKQELKQSFFNYKSDDETELECIEGIYFFFNF